MMAANKKGKQEDSWLQKLKEERQIRRAKEKEKMKGRKQKK